MQSEGARRRLQGLIDLAWRSLPRVADGTGEFDDWGTYARATVARCAYLGESVLLLGDRPLDGEVVARSLFEHVITFAWVAVDPSEHLAIWVGDDIRSRKVFLEENERKFKFEGLDDDTKADFARLASRLPSVADRARVADEHWLGVFKGIFEGRSSLSALYSIGYRGYSASVHPTALGLGPFLTGTIDRRVTVGRPLFHPRRCPFAECTSALTALLYVSGEALKWPEEGKVAEIWRKSPAKSD